MTPWCASARANIAGCRAAAEIHDDEVAHSLEDDARADVLRAVVAGEAHAARVAAEVLALADLDFARWCA